MNHMSFSFCMSPQTSLGTWLIKSMQSLNKDQAAK